MSAEDRAWPEELEAAAQQRSSDGYFAIDPAGTILHWSPAAERSLGYAPGRTLGAGLADLLLLHPSRQPDRLQAYIERTLEEGSTRFQWPVRTGDGPVIMGDITLSVVPAANEPTLLVHVRDVTHFKAMREIGLLRGTWQPIAESFPDGVLLVNSEGNIVLINRQAAALFGYEFEELLARPVETLVPHRFGSVHRIHRTRYAEEPTARQMGAGRELSGRRRDGTEFPLEISLKPLPGYDDLLVLATVVDITHRKVLESQRTAQAELEGVLLTVRELSDRLVNLLGAPSGFLDLLEAELDHQGVTLPEHLTRLFDSSRQAMEKSVEYLNSLQQVTRVKVRSTPLGPALDVEGSTSSDPDTP